MPDRYKVLNYRGDRRDLEAGLVVPATGRRVPLLLGADAFGSPYEVLDVDYDAELDRSRVHLAPATDATRRGHRSALIAQRTAGAEQAAHEATVRHFWRPDVWPAPAPATTSPETAAAMRAVEAGKLAQAGAA